MKDIHNCLVYIDLHTLFDSTVCPKACTIGFNELIGTNTDSIKSPLDKLFVGQWKEVGIPLFLDGHTTEMIVDIFRAL